MKAAFHVSIQGSGYYNKAMAVLNTIIVRISQPMIASKAVYQSALCL